MHIILIPQRRDDTLMLSREGDVLIINEEAYDFSQVPDGATLPASAIDSEFIVHEVQRIDGVLYITIILPHGADASEAARFPAPIIDPPNGVVELPQ